MINCDNIRLYGDLDVPDAPLVVMIENEHEAEKVWMICRESGSCPFVMAGIPGVDWEHDLSPWAAEAVFKNGSDFTGGADAFLEGLQKQIIAVAESRREQKGNEYPEIYLAGYSLAGLFSVYAAYCSDLFAGIVSASGSLWFPGFKDYVQEHRISSQLKKAYFSVGDREERTKHILMRQVQRNTEYTAEVLAGQGIETTFVLNSGGHFVNPDERLARGIAWVLQ